MVGIVNKVELFGKVPGSKVFAADNKRLVRNTPFLPQVSARGGLINERTIPGLSFGFLQSVTVTIRVPRPATESFTPGNCSPWSFAPGSTAKGLNLLERSREIKRGSGA